MDELSHFKFTHKGLEFSARCYADGDTTPDELTSGAGDFPRGDGFHWDRRTGHLVHECRDRKTFRTEMAAKRWLNSSILAQRWDMENTTYGVDNEDDGTWTAWADGVRNIRKAKLQDIYNVRIKPYMQVEPLTARLLTDNQRFVTPSENYANETLLHKARYALQDFNRLSRFFAGKWSYLFVQVEIKLEGITSLSSGIGGVNSDDEEYIKTIANEEAAELIDNLNAKLPKIARQIRRAAKQP